MNEDDTFRILRRRPIEEVYAKRRVLMANFRRSEDASDIAEKRDQIVLDSGWTLEEFYNHRDNIF